MAAPASQSLNDAAFARAHQALLAHSGFQFDPESAPAATRSDWLEALLNAIGHLSPVLKIAVWIGLAAVIVTVLAMAARHIVLTRSSAPISAPPSWRPDETRARILLADADRLAAANRFAEAAHLILLRSIEDIDGAWPQLVKPALTSRDIAAHPALPDATRQIFAAIAAQVERSLFGGAPLGPADFAACRQAYANFAFPARS